MSSVLVAGYGLFINLSSLSTCTNLYAIIKNMENLNVLHLFYLLFFATAASCEVL